MNLIELTTKIDSEEKARAFLEKMRWPNGVVCPRCGHEHISRLAAYGKYECAKCEYQFSVTSGTFMHKTRVPLRKWLIAAYLLCESKKGISAKQIQRMIEVSYPTAWHMMHRIREAMKPGDGEEKLTGILEADETYIGGKTTAAQDDRHGGKSNKTIVLGIIERGGRVRCQAVESVRIEDIRNFVWGSAHNIDVLYTDQLAAYRILDRWVNRKSLNHKLTYIDGDIHTNGIEGFWSLLKRGINGAFHHVSAKHLQRYLNEFIWRFNNRENEAIFESLLRKCGGAMLQYSELTH